MTSQINTDEVRSAVGAAPAAYSPASTPSAAALRSGLTLPGWGQVRPGEELVRAARETPAGRQLARAWSRWDRLFTTLRTCALERLRANEPIDPNDRAVWPGSDAHADAVLRRHGINLRSTHQLCDAAIKQIVAHQSAADEQAGVDWTVLHDPPSRLDEPLRRAHATVPLDLNDPRNYGLLNAKRDALARRVGLDPASAEDLSRWVVDHPEDFDAENARCWRIASRPWFSLVDELLGAVGDVERPVGIFLLPDAKGDGWRLAPCLSLPMIRLVRELGGVVDRELLAAEVPGSAAAELVERVNSQTLHHGPREMLDSRTQLADALRRQLDVHVALGPFTDPLDRWGRLVVDRSAYRDRTGKDVSHVYMRALTLPTRGLSQRRLGATGAGRGRPGPRPSAAMDLGEAVSVAVDAGLPLLLSSEASGELSDRVRVGRMKGRPGVLTFTRSDGFAATSERVVVEQAIPRLRALKAAGEPVVLDGGARQTARMALVRALEDDPVLFPPQRELGALKVVGSGVDASQVGAGKTVTTGRALYHRAAQTPRFRGMVVAEGRLLGQWRDELVRGAPGRGLPPLLPNAVVQVIDERTSVAGQLRAFDRAAGVGGGVALVPNSILDRYPHELATLDLHVLFADEGLRYANPATEAHRALVAVRMSCVADCWILTGTPKGKSAETIDVLTGIALGDQAMIAERLNTREAGNLLDETNAHRLRVNYGPHFQRITRKQMEQWVPKVLPARPLAIDPDPALRTLLEAIRQGGRDAYRRLLGVLAQLKTLERGSELHRQALVELSRVQGVVLGNVGVYVDASVDPETLMHSQAALAQALVQQGLVQEAMRGGGDGLPLLRGIVAQTLANVAGEEQALVFADRVRCLRQLTEVLRGRHGVDARVADGSLSDWQFEDMKAAFVAGEFPVLCLSPIGREGHNLQSASVLAHLDLPWREDFLEQRVGRLARPGSPHQSVQPIIPYIKGAGIEHVVSVLAPRGAESHQILDSFEGVRADESTVATQLGEITSDVAESKHEAGYEATAAKLRVAAAVFGH